MSLLDVITSLVRQANLAFGPKTFNINYPADHPLRGQPAGMMALKTDREGSRYELIPHPRTKAEPHTPVPERVYRHTFTSLESLEHFVNDQTQRSAAEPEVFISVERFGSPASVRAVVDEQEPERGMVGMAIQRHPSFQRWLRLFPEGGSCEAILSHDAFSEFLLNNAHDLEDPMLAKMIATIRAAKGVEFDGSDTGYGNVKVQWKTVGKDESSMGFPPGFTARLPAFAGSGVWPPGQEPTFEAHFRLRVLPPPRDASDPTPRWRIVWENVQAFEDRAVAALEQAVTAKLEGSAAVYLGVPNVVRYVVVPEKSEPAQLTSKQVV